MFTQKLRPDVSEKFTPYLRKMIDIHTDNLLSVCFYGSATGQNYHPQKSDINSIFVFKTLDFTTLEKSLKIIKQGLAQKITTPLFLTKEYIRSSLDTFPIEFLDIKENHITVYGEDIFSELEIKGQRLRLFCEQQVKGKFLRIRQAYLEVGLDHRKVQKLLKESLNSLFPVFRNLLRLKGCHHLLDKMALIETVSQECHLQKEILLDVYRHSNHHPESPQHTFTLLEKYLDEIQKLSAFVDR